MHAEDPWLAEELHIDGIRVISADTIRQRLIAAWYLHHTLHAL